MKLKLALLCAVLSSSPPVLWAQEKPRPEPPKPEPAQPPPEQPKPSEEPGKAPIVSERLKTLIDKVRDRVVGMEEALKASGTVLHDYEAAITGKTLTEIDFKLLADSVGTARASLREILSDADVLVRRLDREVMESMAEEERLLFKDGTRQIDAAKAARLTRTIRTILEVHEVLPGDSLARLSLETLADQIDSYIDPQALDEFADISTISTDIVRSLILYRDSIHRSLETLRNLEQILSVLENKSRDLYTLISREGQGPDKASMARVRSLIQDIERSREKALSIFRKIGRKVRDLRRGKEHAEESGDRMQDLRKKYLEKEGR